MELQELKEKALAQLKVDGVVLLENQVKMLVEPAMDLALGKLKAVIPGQIDDAVIDMVAPMLIKLIKEEIEKGLEKLKAL